MKLSAEEARRRLVLALDVGSFQEAETIVAEVREHIGVFKVGMELFTSEGPRVVHFIQKQGGNVFLDLKYHDIPNTVAGAARSATRMGVFLFDVHASGGSVMMQRVAETVRDEAAKLGVRRPLVLAVTVLTSLSPGMLQRELHVDRDLSDQVVDFARLAQGNGIDGVVASPQEIRPIREACGTNFTILTPGIRLKGTATDDQQRVTTPLEAIEMGSDFIVVGRPILRATDRVKACQEIVAEMQGD